MGIEKTVFEIPSLIDNSFFRHGNEDACADGENFHFLFILL
jgi:hypothetical protein